MNEKKEIKTVGLGFFEALTLLFIALKLTGVVTWSWLWVLSPLWLTFMIPARRSGFLCCSALLL